MAGFFESLFGGDDDAASIPLPQAVPFRGSLPAPFPYMAPPTPTTYAPTGMPGAEANLLGGISGLGGYNVAGAYLPWARAIGESMITDPTAAGYRAGAGRAADLGTTAALNQFGQGGNLYGLGRDIIGTAFDPQQDLYARTLGRTTEAARAAGAARGLVETPFGAGLENEAVRNFNIDWQNAQLARQIAGGQAAGGLIGQGAGLQAGAAPLYMQSAAMPWQTGQQINLANLGTLGQLGQFGQAAATIPQQQIANWNNYLNLALQMQAAANQAPLAQYYAGLGGQQQAFGQAQTAGFTDPLVLAQFGQGQQNQMFQDALARQKQAEAESASMWGGLGSLAGGLWGTGLKSGGTVGSAVMGALPFLSDVREKEDIQPLGVDEDSGVNLYAFRYRGDPKHYPKVVGPLAQELAQTHPEAVTEIGGRLFVGLRGLGAL